MSKKATHKGTCQVCGREQKLPGGRLSQHGYTTRCGFFEGVCTGAGWLPFEQDISLIEGAINRAGQQLADTKAFQDTLRAPVTPGTKKAWVLVYLSDWPRNSWRKPGYYWEEVELYMEEHQHGDHKWTTYHYPKIDGMGSTGDNPRFREVCAHSAPRKKTIEEAVAACNEKKAQSLDATLAEIETYIKWQRERIKGWKPQPLKPIAKGAKV